VTDNDQQVASDSRTIVVKNRESHNSEADNNQTSTDASNDNTLDTDTTNNNIEINTDNKKSGGAISGLFCLFIVQFLAWRQKKNIKYYLQKPNK
jgi:hypothetical protein